MSKKPATKVLSRYTLGPGEIYAAVEDMVSEVFDEETFITDSRYPIRLAVNIVDNLEPKAKWYIIPSDESIALVFKEHGASGYQMKFVGCEGDEGYINVTVILYGYRVEKTVVENN